MNVNTGELRRLSELTEDEAREAFWQRVPSHLNKQADKAIKNGGCVPLGGNSKLAKFAKTKREKPKGIISKKRFRTLKKEMGYA